MVMIVLPILLSAQSFSGGPVVGAIWGLTSIDDIKSPAVDNVLESVTTANEFLLGGQVRYDFKQPLFVRTGIIYKQSSFEHQITGLIFGNDIANGTTSTLNNKVSMTMLSLPFEIGGRSEIVEDQLYILLGAGAWVNMLLYDETEASLLNDGRAIAYEATINEVDAATLSGTVFLGVEMALSKRTFLGVEPYLRYTPNTFKLVVYESVAKTNVEVGVTARLRIGKP